MMILTQTDLVEYSRHIFIRMGLLALLLLVVLPGCSNRAGLDRPRPVISTDLKNPLGSLEDSELRRKREQFDPDHYDNVYHSDFNNIWQRIVSLYALPEEWNTRIEREMRAFLKQPGFLERTQLRAEPYLFEIVDQIERQGIPGEFALLPIVESAFQPYAYSPADASGIWQFIPSTARLYGLEQNWWYDGRRDIYAATRAAIRYLKKLNDDFNGDWLLALAAYNCGEGTVQNAINRNLRRRRPTDFWSLDLPRETRSYVPRLLAVSKLFANAERYGTRLLPIKDRPYFKNITVTSQVDLKMAAELAEISMHKLYLLNPGYNQWATSPYGPHRLLIPVENARILFGKMDQLSEATKVQWRRHRVNQGDSLKSIAENYGTLVANIQKANKLTAANLTPGNHLIVPVSDVELQHHNYSPNPNALGFGGSTAQALRKVYYKVRRGDTLSVIAQRHSVRLSSLLKWNRLNRRSLIHPGKNLVIWKNQAGRMRLTSYGTKNYTIRKGDSLYVIARRFNVSISSLRQLNRTTIGKYLIPGQKIKIPGRPAS